MIEYILTNKETNNVLSSFSWGNAEIPQDYPIEDTQTILKIEDENIYSCIQNSFRSGKQLKIKNSNATTFEEMFEDYIPEPIPQTVQPPSNADLQKQIFDLTTQLVTGGII